ncbi:SETMR methyltransferase, partial [Acromyrmex insinuator]
MEILRENFRAMIFYDINTNLTPKQCIDRLHLAFGDEAPCNRIVYNWFAEFQRGHTFLCDEGRPSTSVVATNVDAMREMIERDRYMTYCEIQASLGIDMKVIHILHDHLSVRKLCSRWIPHNLIEVQKQTRVKWSKEMLKKFNRDLSNLVYNIITGDETWIYSYEPESKQQSTSCHTTHQIVDFLSIKNIELMTHYRYFSCCDFEYTYTFSNAYREYNVMYLHSNDLAKRHAADNILTGKPRKRITASDFSEREWFVQFYSGNFDVKDRPRSGRPVTEKVDEILQLVKQDRHVSCQGIANALRINMTVWNHLKKAGYAKKLDVWVPHELTQRNLIDRISISETLLKRNEIDPFLKQIITGDEKWEKYKNIVRKRSWNKRGEPPQTTSKPGLMANKLYCSQLDRLQEVIKEKRPELIYRKGIVFHHDNARSHTSLMTRQKLRELGWEVLMHPPYSPDLAPSDYHLFRSLQNSLDEKTLADERAAENHLKKFFADKPQKFYTDGITRCMHKFFPLF